MDEALDNRFCFQIEQLFSLLILDVTLCAAYSHRDAQPIHTIDFLIVEQQFTTAKLAV